MRIILCTLLLTLPGLASAAKPAFELDEKATRALVEAALQLKNGDSANTVISKLGKPTTDQVMQRKRDAKPFGRTLGYYAVIWERGLVNELFDEYVRVFLDDQDRVKSITIRITLKQ